METCKVLINQEVMAFTIKNDAFTHQELKSALNFIPTGGGFLDIYVDEFAHHSFNINGESISCNLKINPGHESMMSDILYHPDRKLYYTIYEWNGRHTRIYAMTTSPLHKDPVDNTIEFDNHLEWTEMSLDHLSMFLGEDYSKMIYGDNSKLWTHK